MFQRFFKNRKIKKYARKLPQDLKSHYGYKQHYSKVQVDYAIKRKKLGKSGAVIVTDNCYAYAMYCSPEEFKEIHDNAGENCDYAAMRSEISDTLFNGACDFSFSTLLVESTNSTSSFSTGDFGGDGGGGFGGGDGGGGGD